MSNPITQHPPNTQSEQTSRKKLAKEQAERLRESYEERRAILEFDGGYTRAQADRLAWSMTYGKQYK